MAQALIVELGSRSYPIDFPHDLSSTIQMALVEASKAGRVSVLLTDEGVVQAQAKFLAENFSSIPRLILPAGEKTKSLASLGQVLDFLAAERIDRSSILWVLGGGVMGDLGGFAAASYLRGIDFMQVPTTLLAMVDSSIGGKTGINLSAGKNLVGALHHPRAVFVDTDFLRTLPEREFAAGMAEVIKYGLLGDAGLWAQLEREPLTIQSAALLPTIRRCCEMKAAIVQADERETAKEGGRALLNLGHTFGHAIEQVTGYGPYLHGEAVAVGLVAAARLSLKLGYISTPDATRVEQCLLKHHLPAALRAPLTVGALMEAMQRDKKNRAGQLRFVVLRRLGEAATQAGIDPKLVESVWREIGATG